MSSAEVHRERWARRLGRVFLLCLAVQLSLVVCLAGPGAEFWTQFRGPNQNGSLDVDSIPDIWSVTSHIAWECEIEGGGNSSPVIWGNKLFLTSAKIDHGTVGETFVIALERASGKQLWRTPIPILSLPGRPPSHENGCCYDAKTGRKIWSGGLNDQFYAAPVAAAGEVIFASRRGRFHLLRASDTFDPIQTVTMAQPCDVSPAIAEGHLYLRTKLGSNRTTIWCVDK